MLLRSPFKRTPFVCLCCCALGVFYSVHVKNLPLNNGNTISKCLSTARVLDLEYFAQCGKLPMGLSALGLLKAAVRVPTQSFASLCTASESYHRLHLNTFALPSFQVRCHFPVQIICSSNSMLESASQRT